MNIRERKHRLDRKLYLGEIYATFTVCIKNRRPTFVNQAIFDDIEKLLVLALKKFDCEAPVYLFMPDHCHITLNGKTEKSDLYKCIVYFKQLSGYYRAKGNIFWQKDFYDHILRIDEDLRKHIIYILNNPVRKRLVEDWELYPYKGSTVFDFSEW